MLEFYTDENGDNAVRTDAIGPIQFTDQLAQEVFSFVCDRIAESIRESLDAMQKGAADFTHESILLALAEATRENSMDLYANYEGGLEDFISKSLLIYLKLSGYKADKVQEKRILWVSDQQPQTQTVRIPAAKGAP